MNKVDDIIEQKVEYAYHEQLGYLTCCPTNVGTGMRASVMMHLPALTINKQMNLILQTISKIGLTPRYIWGRQRGPGKHLSDFQPDYPGSL